MSKYIRKYLAGGVSILVLAGMAVGEAAAAAAFEEIVVTARKREERLLDVPSAITALGGDTLRKTASAALADFVSMVPGLNLADTGFGSFQNFRIRGVATGTSANVLQSSVSIYFDETQTMEPYIPFGTADFYLADIDRIEVLRGLQGTLFGSGSLSGLVRIIPRKPQLAELAGYVDGSVMAVDGGQTDFTLEGMINVPLGEKYAARAVAYQRNVPGYIDNIARNEKNVNSGDVTGGRLAIYGEPSEQFHFTASVAHQHDQYDDGARSFVDGGAGGARQWNALSEDFRDQKVTLVTLNATLKTGIGDLTSITSYLQTKPYGGYDNGTASPLLGVPGTATYNLFEGNYKSWIEEVRLSSTGDGPFTYVIGAYYSNRKADVYNQVRNPFLENLLGLSNVFGQSINSKVTELAGFGELGYRITDDITFTAGIRVFRNKLDARQISDGLLNGFQTVIANGKNKESDYTPKFTLTWQPLDGLTIYAQAAKGYRVGQINVVTGPDIGVAPPTFDPDYIWNYEVGVKSQFWDGRGQLALAAFYIDWKDLQVSLPGVLAIYTDNAGSARSIGLEAEGSIIVMEGLQLSTALAYTDAQITEDVPLLIQPSGQIGVFDGDRLPGSVKFTMTNAAQYNHDINDETSFFIRVEHQYSSGAWNSFSQVGAYRINDFSVVNMSAGIELPYGIDVSLYARNIGNSDAASNILFDYFNVTDQAIRMMPRNFGLSVRKNF